MTHEDQTDNSVAPLRNVRALAELIDRVQTRDRDLPGMACFYGFSGYGKSSAAAWCSNRADGSGLRPVYVEVRSVWRAGKLCRAILTELRISDPARTMADMVEQICDELARSGRTLLIDEADKLCRAEMIETVRDIYEGSKAPIILIGEEKMPQSLQRWERVHGRMLDWVAAQPADLRDVQTIARLFYGSIEIDEPLAQHILTSSQGSIRRIRVSLADIREHAQQRGLTRVTRADWGTRKFHGGNAPAPRMIA